jgi:hypothetical protein
LRLGHNSLFIVLPISIDDSMTCGIRTIFFRNGINQRGLELLERKNINKKDNIRKRKYIQRFKGNLHTIIHFSTRIE